MTTPKKPVVGKKAEEPRIAPLFGTPGIGKNAIIERATMEQNLRDRDKQIRHLRAELTDRNEGMRSISHNLQVSVIERDDARRSLDTMRKERDTLAFVVKDAGIKDVRIETTNGVETVAYTPAEPKPPIAYGQGALPGDKHLNSYGRPTQATMVQREADAKIANLKERLSMHNRTTRTHIARSMIGIRVQLDEAIELFRILDVEGDHQ